MWIASRFGWFSIVKQADDAYAIRARKREDIESLLSFLNVNIPILESEKQDYRCRIVVTEHELLTISCELFQDIDYPNFKEMIGKNENQRDKLAYYHEIWGIMWDYQIDQKIMHPTEGAREPLEDSFRFEDGA